MLNDLGNVINKPFSGDCYRLQTSHTHLACKNEEVLTKRVYTYERHWLNMDHICSYLPIKGGLPQVFLRFCKILTFVISFLSHSSYFPLTPVPLIVAFFPLSFFLDLSCFSSAEVSSLLLCSFWGTAVTSVHT